MLRLLSFYSILLLFISCNAPTTSETATSTTDSLKSTIEQIIAERDATVGVSIMGNDGTDTIAVNGDQQFPMQSVFKFHISLAMLSEVDKGNFALEQEIAVSKDELLPEHFYSPLRDENPEGGNFTIARLIEYAVSQSDNTACDVLIALLGTPKTVESYFKKNGIDDIEITFNERDMQAKWENMFQNWTTPIAASRTLRLFYDNGDQLLSKESHDFIWRVMRETSTGKERLRGHLPQETVVAHKTGWSGTNEETGITDAVNDIGIIFLPDGRHFFISVFVTDSKENNEVNERIIADIAKAAYDYYMEQTP